MKSPKDGFQAEVLDAIDIGLIVLDEKRAIVGWNAWITSATRIGADAACGHTIDRLFPESSLRRLAVALDDAFEAGTSSLLTHSLNPYLLPLRTRAGRPMVHDVSVRPLATTRGQRCIIQIVDVTLATERERILRARQNARYGAVVDNAPDAILTLNSLGIIELANPAAHRELGYAHSELLGTPLREILEEATIWDQVWPSILAGDLFHGPLSLAALRKNGSIAHIELSASRWLSEARTYVTVILRDVSDRRAVEAELRSLNETLEERVINAIAERNLLADIVETTDAFIQVLDLECRVLAVNKASSDDFENLYGVRPKAGDDMLELLADHPLERENVKGFWARALTGETFSVIHDFDDASGNRRHYELKFNSLRDEAGQLIAAFQFGYNVTEKVLHQEQLARTEEALRQSQKMEAIGQLTGGIAHDFNNLLMGISGSIELLRRRINTGKYDETQRFMDAAATSASRAAALTHRLLAFARRQPLDIQSIDVNQLISGVEDLLRRSLGEQIVLKIDLRPDLWPTLTDANQLENALLNLAINARDAMVEGGVLSITTQNEFLPRSMKYGEEEIEAGSYTIIRVSDTGTGMAPEVAAKVFEPFFTTKPIGQGTGLGLSMIYGFAKQSHGYVRIESAVGEGTTVLIYLPRSEEVPKGAASDADEVSAGAGQSVLLVEDDSSVRLLIKEVLNELGYSCVEACDGETAMAVLESNIGVDLMITDVGLPGMNGRRLAEMARGCRPQLKILFVTGYAKEAAHTEQFLQPGMGLVTKPFVLDVLAMKIRDILMKRHPANSRP
jgi:PAS domain S-box-containing protein